MKVGELAGGDVVRRGKSHDTFIGMSSSPRAYSDQVQSVWYLSTGEISIEETDPDEDVGFLSSYRNSNVERLAGVFCSDFDVITG